MPTPPMLRPRDPEPVPSYPDPVASLTVAALTVIALGLLAAAVLAVYTYSTPGVVLPLVIAITLAFATVVILNLLHLAARRLRRG